MLSPENLQLIGRVLGCVPGPTATCAYTAVDVQGILDAARAEGRELQRQELVQAAAEAAERMRRATFAGMPLVRDDRVPPGQIRIGYPMSIRLSVEHIPGAVGMAVYKMCGHVADRPGLVRQEIERAAHRAAPYAIGELRANSIIARLDRAKANKAANFGMGRLAMQEVWIRIDARASRDRAVPDVC